MEMVGEQMKKSGLLAIDLIVKSVSLLSEEDWTDTLRETQVDQ